MSDGCTKVERSRQPQYNCECGHTLRQHGPADETNRLPCKIENCPCNAYGSD